MAVRLRAYPHIGPGGRNREGLDALQYVGIPHLAAVGAQIAKSLPRLSPPESRTLVTHVGEPGVLGGFLGIDDRFGGAQVEGHGSSLLEGCTAVVVHDPLV
jgi:hypothetical protein